MNRININIVYFQYVAIVALVIIMLKIYTNTRKEKKRRDNMKKYAGKKFNIDTQHIRKTQKVEKKVIDNDDPWALYGDPWDDLDKKEGKKNA
jgi:hypothetical protein